MPKKVSRRIGKPVGRIYMGVDPGISGGFAFITQGGIVVGYDPMPKTELDIWKYISSRKGVHKVFIEQVHAMPKQGVSSVFKFGYGYGGLRMAILAASLPFQEVRPAEWQKEIGVVRRKKDEPKQHHKERLRAKCQNLFPSLDAWNQPLGYQRSICDALLIALYGQRYENSRSRTTKER